MSVTICHARGGDPSYTPGNQTGRELAQGSWYNGGWTLLLRPKSPTVAERIAAAAETGVKNMNIGYGQADRNTARAQAKLHNMRLDLIDKPCNCDCSSFVSLCAEIAGAIGEAQYSGGNAPWTGNMREKFTGSGAFEALTEGKYLTSPDYLRRGDILVNEPAATGHTVVVTGNGPLSQAAADSSPAEQGSLSAANPGNGVEVNGERVEPWAAKELKAEAVESSDRAYTVQWGDTLWDIAQKYGTSVGAICALNGLDPEKYIYEGQVVVIPK